MVETKASATVLANEPRGDVYSGWFLAELYPPLNGTHKKRDIPDSGWYKLHDIWDMAAVWEQQLRVGRIKNMIICI